MLVAPSNPCDRASCLCLRTPGPQVVGKREQKDPRADEEERACLVHDSLREMRVTAAAVYRYSALTRPQLVDFVGTGRERNTWTRLFCTSAT
jgi:hypothetical protein